jgi:4'-phosphopantetheinyl transferase
MNVAFTVPQSTVPAEKQIHLWWIDLDAHTGDDVTLSDHERLRARRKRPPQLRARFVATHSTTRAILARYLATDPSAVRIVLSAAGKPLLDASTHGPEAPTFSLSHSGAYAVLAVSTSDGAIGVDVESDQSTPTRATMLNALSPQELADVSAMDEAALRIAFHIAWTRKEACLKAIGSGFTVSPRVVDVGIRCAPRTVSLTGAPLAGVPTEQRVVQVVTRREPAPFTVSIACEGAPGMRIETFQFAAR